MHQLICYKKMPIWTQESIPSGFKKQHNTKVGTWAKLVILEGQLHFAFVSEQGEVLSEHCFTAVEPAPMIEPQVWHKIVSASSDVRCQLEFYCQPMDYFSKKYQLSSIHSEVIAALPYLAGGQALDVGCGTGRNSLFLSQNGFDVEAWDVNENSIAKLDEIIATEQIENIFSQRRDLNLNPQIDRDYNFICCTVVMMFLQPQTIAQLVNNMQAATLPQGFNLIVCAMNSEDYPAQQDFPFTFQAGELLAYYRDWNILKYNEDVGHLHRVDAHGQPIAQRFATLLAQKPAQR